MIATCSDNAREARRRAAALARPATTDTLKRVQDRGPASTGMLERWASPTSPARTAGRGLAVPVVNVARTLGGPALARKSPEGGAEC
jgi:hypothetical protein